MLNNATKIRDFNRNKLEETGENASRALVDLRTMNLRGGKRGSRGIWFGRGGLLSSVAAGG